MTDNDYGAWKSIMNAARKAPDQDFTVWREAGADRYLLRFETSNRALLDRIHLALHRGGG